MKKLDYIYINSYKWIIMKYVLVGQKNVGKSSIFNKILGKKINIVDKIKGSTRDLIEYESLYKDKVIYITDTPGIDPVSKNLYDKNILNYLKLNIPKDSSILFVVDVSVQSINIDMEILRFLRKLNKNIILIINKTDNEILKENLYKFLKFGINQSFFISCTHNSGFKTLKNYLFEKSLYSINDIKILKNEELSIGVYGKPNVGKSTFINSFLGFNRFQTGNVPGLTTDSIYHLKKFNNRNIKIFDTAGIKQKNKLNNTLEIQSSNVSIKNISNTLINLVIIDCNEGLDRQDKRIINILAKKGVFLIIVFNKIDLIPNIKEVKKNQINQLYDEIYQAKNLKYFFISSLETKDIKKIFNYILKDIIFDNKISTSNLNKWLKIATEDYPHPFAKGKKINFKYAVQLQSFPLTIKIFTNYPKYIIESYKRYLVNNFIDKFRIRNQNITILFNKTENPFAK